MRIGKMKVMKEQDMLLVRQAVKDVGRWMDFSYLDVIRIATAASELTRNMLEHARGGEIWFEIVDNKGLKLIFTDQGEGIRDISAVLSESYESQVGMGIGLKGAKRLMDEFEIESGPDRGTRVTITKWLKPEQSISQANVHRIRFDFTEISEESALEELKSQNRELVEVLNQLKETHAQLEVLNKELEMTNAGTIALYQEIDRKNDALNQENTRKTEFLRSLGHEVRTPINSIITMTGLLLRKKDGPLHVEQEKQVVMIRESAEHLLNVVNDLLDLSKIEAGIIEYNLSLFTVEDLFLRASATIAALAEEKGLSLTFEHTEDVPNIESDAKMVLQVLLNLLGNAVKFTDQGRIIVSAYSERVSDGDYIRIDVKDTGIGIPERELESIFEQFRRVYSSDDIRKGSGLGLPIARSLLEHLGGSIQVKSVPGEGSRFSFTLPVRFPMEKKALIPQETEILPSCEASILIVDDDEKFIHTLTGFLKKHGYTSTVARTAEQAVRIATQQRFIMVLLDLLLPREEDGWMVLKALQHNPKTRDIPVIVMTVLHEAGEKARALGANEFLTKPVDMAELLNKLKGYAKTETIETILVIDDEEAIIAGIEAHLGEKYTILTARDGAEALQVLHMQKPDAIILDLIMPVMDGFEFLEMIRQETEYVDIPVIAYTSKELNSEKSSMLHRNGVITIHKQEIGVEDLSGRMNDILFHHHRGEVNGYNSHC